MNQEDNADNSPLRSLDACFGEAMIPGEVALLAAPPGVGKTTFLVHVGLDNLLRGERVLHIGIGSHSLDSIQSWYDTLLEDSIEESGNTYTDEALDQMVSNRVFHAHGSPHFSPNQLQATLPLFTACMGFKPSVILIDGYDGWSDLTEFHDFIATVKSAAASQGASAWISIKDKRLNETGAEGGEGAEMVVGLKSEGDNTRVILHRVRDQGPSETPVLLEANTMRLFLEHDGSAQRKPSAGQHTLLSGGARGAECCFGENAEKWGVDEIHYSFEERPVGRERGITLLSDDELSQGAVISRYLRDHMNRTYPDTPLFKKVLQSIWHQVNTSREVFVIGTILTDKTVKGGTGWAAELAKHFGKPLHVFDQEHESWFKWEGKSWVEEEPPLITKKRFTGTGSRFLTEAGKAAIESLFTRTFEGNG